MVSIPFCITNISQHSSIIALYKETRHFISDYTSHSSQYKKALIIRLSHPDARYEHHTLQDMLHHCLIPLASLLQQQRLLRFTHPPYTEIEVFLRYFVRHDPHLLLNNLARGTFSFPESEVVHIEKKVFTTQTKSVKHSGLFFTRLLVPILLSFALFFCFLFYHDQRNQPHDAIKNTVAIYAGNNALAPLHVSFPIRIIIPAIQVNASIEQVGITPKGAMAVPSGIDNVGWYNLGPHPGEPGSAVIAGHYDGIQGTSGVFAKLHLLKDGDKIDIEDSDGKGKSFLVKKSRIYTPDADTTAVFGQSTGTHLNLITCDGVWDQTQKIYSKRLVVFADVIH